MLIVYVAGPFRAHTPWEVEANVRRAEALALEVAEAGAMPLCPHTNTRFFDGLLHAGFWLEGTLELLRRCDAVILVDGWERSRGTQGEIEEAGRRGIPVFHEVGSLREWLRKQGA